MAALHVDATPIRAGRTPLCWTPLAADLLVPPPGAVPAPDLTIADVAAACGYADHSHLDREFRALAGCAPGAYVAAWRAVGVDASHVVDLGAQPGRSGR